MAADYFKSALARRAAITAVITTILGAGAVFTVTKLTPTDAIRAEKIWEVKSSSGSAVYADGNGNLTASGTIISDSTTNVGWSVQAAANQACNTTCTFACVVGQDTGAAGNLVACTDANADRCLCAGGS